MHALIGTLQHSSRVALLLALAMGFWFGALKFGSFSLDSVTSTLIAGLLIGQLHITVAPVLQNRFLRCFSLPLGTVSAAIHSRLQERRAATSFLCSERLCGWVGHYLSGCQAIGDITRASRRGCSQAE